MKERGGGANWTTHQKPQLETPDQKYLVAVTINTSRLVPGKVWVQVVAACGSLPLQEAIFQNPFAVNSYLLGQLLEMSNICPAPWLLFVETSRFDLLTFQGRRFSKNTVPVDPPPPTGADKGATGRCQNPIRALPRYPLARSQFSRTLPPTLPVTPEGIRWTRGCWSR